MTDFAITIGGSLMPRLPGWTHAIRIDIDYTGGIGASVTHFPITIFLKAGNGDATKVFDEIGANSQKIAITKSDGLTQLYAEIDTWDAVAGEAVIHTSKSDWVIDADTWVYLYYDAAHANNTAYIGVVPGVAPTTNVWDDNFVMVQHMNDTTTSSITDSTQYDNDGAKKGANEPVEATGQIGKAQDFDGSDDYINTGDDLSINPASQICISTWVYLDPSISATGFIVNRDSWPDRYYVLHYEQGANRFYGRIWQSDNSVKAVTDGGVLTLGQWYYVLMQADGAEFSMYVNGILYGTPIVYDGTLNQDAIDTYIGAQTGGGAFRLNGMIDEVRISNSARSAAWVKAEYNAGADTLLTYGHEETFEDGGGGLSGTLIRTMYRALGGVFTPTGALLEALIIVMALGGELDLEGALSGRNPAWLLLDDTLRWMGEWVSTYSYDQNDTVLYRADATEDWHVFTSKVGHNVGNIPDSSSAFWRRLYQEKWL